MVHSRGKKGIFLQRVRIGSGDMCDGFRGAETMQRKEPFRAYLWWCKRKDAREKNQAPVATAFTEVSIL